MCGVLAVARTGSVWALHGHALCPSAPGLDKDASSLVQVVVVLLEVGGLRPGLKWNGITMMDGRPGRVPLKLLPDEARNLPPPKLNDPRLLYMGFLGYCSGLVDNAFRQRPVVIAGEGCAGGGSRDGGGTPG